MTSLRKSASILATPNATEPRLEVTFQDPRHAEWALWQLATNAEALAPRWLRTALRNRATTIATRYEANRRVEGQLDMPPRLADRSDR